MQSGVMPAAVRGDPDPSICAPRDHDSTVLAELLCISTGTLLEAINPGRAFSGGAVVRSVVPPAGARAAVLNYGGSCIEGDLTLLCGEKFLSHSFPESTPIPAGDAEYRDWVAELTNQLLGRIKNKLLHRGVEFQVSTPSSLALIAGVELQGNWFQFAQEENWLWVRMTVLAQPSWRLPPDTGKLEEVAHEGDMLLF